MALSSSRFKRLSWKLTLLIGVALLLITVLFSSSFIGLRKVLESNEAIGLLNDVNQVLLQAVVEEKTFLRDHKEDSLKRIVSLTQKAEHEAAGLTVSLGAQSKEIDSLVQLIGKYEEAIKSLGSALQQVDAEDAIISSAVDRFNAKTSEVINLINEYESECQMVGKTPKTQLMTLRNVAKSAVIATSQVFTSLKNRLWSRNNIEEFRAECKQTLNELEKQSKNGQVLVKSLNGKEDKAYVEYLEVMKNTQAELIKSSDTIAETWDRKNHLETELTAISTEVSVLKENIQTLAGDALESQNKSIMKWSLVVYSIIVLALIVGGFLVARSIVVPVTRVIRGLTEGTVYITEASRQVSEMSQQLSDGASQQSAAVEETSSSLEEIASMAKQNAEHASEANQLMTETSQVVSKASESMSHLTASMADISKASEETFKIIKTIDEIAFQTNLLALNAAVEAARAGEAGAGFAVVADEVRNLAMRAAEAAKNTSALIEGTVKKIKEGSDVVKKTNYDFSDVASSSGKMAGLVGEITAASNEQAQGTDQINKAVSEMDKVVQQNAANAEESASASEEISARAEEMKGFVAELAVMVGGS